MKTPSPNKSAQTEMPYGLWCSHMALDELLSQPSAPMYPFRHRGRLCWLEAVNEEGGRIALMEQCDSDTRRRRALTPAPFNIRTNAHEYGGRCFCIFGDHFIFNNLTDGRIYCQDLTAAAAPQAITQTPPAGQTACFADLIALERFGVVLAVMETSAQDHDNNNRVQRDYLVAINLSDKAARAGKSVPQILVEGSDFYACPAVSPKHTQIAWMEWDNPFMPWDESRLVKAELFAADGELACGKISIRKQRVLVQQAEQAVCQIGFLDEHSLLFVSDRGDNENENDNNNDNDNDHDFWDFYVHTDHAYKEQTIKQITKDRYEYGEAQWLFGQHRWQRTSRQTIVAVGTRHDGDSLLKIAIDSGDTIRLPGAFAGCAHLCANDVAQAAHAAQIVTRELLLVARYADREAEIRSLEFADTDANANADAVTDSTHHHLTQSDDQGRALYASTATAISATSAARDGSWPQPITYPTRDGAHAHAYFYAPFNRRHRAPHGTLPPLLVVVHGGPTGRATPELHPLKQYFTSLGYAVLDINHRGSTGYGRAYRQSLLGRWGEMDATDIADGVQHVVAQNLVNPQQVFIRGGSAGGYAVLRALTKFPQMFCGGACYYGIGNLITLAKITHKFEGCYTDRLIGEKFDASKIYEPARVQEHGHEHEHEHEPVSRFVERSPIFQLAQLCSPLILFQGLEDKVVPPELSREVADLLEKKGIQYEYIEYADEGHGFRRLPNRVNSLQKETTFFASIIRAKTRVAVN